MLKQRQSGILLHPTSLPGTQAIGSLGSEAYQFVDFLVDAKQSVWQILPLGPTGYGNCPYSCFSAFAGNPLIINLELIVETGDLNPTDLPKKTTNSNCADFGMAVTTIIPCLRTAASNFKDNGSLPRQKNFRSFCDKNKSWLDDYTLFEAIREHLNFKEWQFWPTATKQRTISALKKWRCDLKNEIYQHKYNQFIFFEQWNALKRYANSKSVQILGDLPIFVATDSADVWAHQELFHLDDNGQATFVAGVPPDYFSSTGQRWGNPLYRWEQMATDNYAWWQSRFSCNFELFDLLRVDHFRGFSSCWAIPANESTAINGSWVEVPGEKLFTCLLNAMPDLPIIAEDLGIITPDVENLRDQFGFPGMKILQFAFDSGDDNPYLPNNHIENSVVYTGTHDNDTTLGWWQSLDQEGKKKVCTAINNDCQQMPWSMIEIAMASVANLAIVPLQDILSLPSTSRMNVPGTPTGNWQWRFKSADLTEDIILRLKNSSRQNNRNLCIPA